ncbi:MAG: BON domain-containing protein [Anaerolineales bacterium]|nr:BON domain-containing protein [Anaerolineales bacterium]
MYATNVQTKSDKEILAAIKTALWQVEPIRFLDLNNLTVTVHDGQVSLSGHVQDRQRIETIAAGVPGVRGVHNKLVEDRDLAIEVAQALVQDPITRPYYIGVDCHQGWVYLSGHVPTPEAQTAVEAVAARIPAGRGIVALPQVDGAPKSAYRSLSQPAVGARVYAHSGPSGHIGQVIVNPQNRLVTHVVVEVAVGGNGRFAASEFVVPMTDVDQVNGNSIFLSRQAEAINAYPRLNEADFPPAPSAWQPPYPYSSDAVRWPLAVLETKTVLLEGK